MQLKRLEARESVDPVQAGEHAGPAAREARQAGRGLQALQALEPMAVLQVQGRELREIGAWLDPLAPSTIELEFLQRAGQRSLKVDAQQPGLRRVSSGSGPANLTRVVMKLTHASQGMPLSS